MVGEEKDEKDKERPYRTRIYTIRGLDPELYEKFSKIAKEIGTNIGALMNEAMKNVIALIEVGKDVGKTGLVIATAPIKAAKEASKEIKDFEVISGVSELEVSKDDLEALDKPVVFTNMSKLVFADDVTWEVIERKVRAIKLVDEVVIPKHIPKLQLVKRCSMVKRIVIKE